MWRSQGRSVPSSRRTAGPADGRRKGELDAALQLADIAEEAGSETAGGLAHVTRALEEVTVEANLGDGVEGGVDIDAVGEEGVADVDGVAADGGEAVGGDGGAIDTDNGDGAEGGEAGKVAAGSSSARA